MDLQTAQMEDATTRRGQDVDRYGIDKTFEVGMGRNANDAFSNQTDRFIAENPQLKPRTFNGEQSKAAGFASRALAAHNAVQESGYDPTKGFGVGERIGMRPDELRAYEASKAEFINAVLRKESGAAISKDEFANAERLYFPTRFDGPEVAAQKAQIRARAIQTMQAESQGAYEMMFGQDPMASGDDFSSMSDDELRRIANGG
jgi:hypothetical protein